MASADIGIRVYLDDAASAGLGNVNSLLRDMGRNALGAHGAFSGLTAQMAMFGVVGGFAAALVAVGAAVKYSVDAASEFQQSLFNLAVATHVPMDAALQYSSTIMDLGAKSTYTSKEITDGVALLGRSGYTLGDIFNKMTQSGASVVDESGKVVQVTSNMAEAGISLGIATRSSAVDGFKMLSQTMAAYSAPAQEATQYANLLQYTFEHQTSTVAQLTSGLSAVTPAAVRLGAPFREVAAALDVVGPAMGNTSMAGTALRYAMTAITSPTATAIKALADVGLITVSSTNPAVQAFTNNLINSGAATADFVKQNSNSVAGLRNLFVAAQQAGIIPLDAKFEEWASGSNMLKDAFFDAKGKAKDFAQDLQLLSDKTKGMNGQELAAFLKDVFSVRGGQGIQILLEQLPKFKKELQDLAASHDNAGGAMSRWQQVMQTFGGAIKGLQTSLTDLGVVVGTQILPYLTTIATNFNTAVTAVRNFANENKQVIPLFLSVAAGLSIVGIVASLVAMGFMGILPPMLIVIGIIMLVFVATMGLAAGITYLATHMSIVKTVINDVKTALGLLLIVAGGVAGAFLGIKVADFALQLGMMLPKILATTAAFIAQIPALISAAVNWTIDMAVSLALNTALLMQLIPTLFRMAIAWIVGLGPAALLVFVVLLLIGLFIAMGIGLVLLVQHMGGMNLIMNIAKGIWAGLVAVFQSVATAVRGALMQSLQQLQPVFQQLVQAFNQAKPALMDFGKVLGVIVVVAVGIVIGVLHGLIMAIGQILVAVIHIISGVIQIFAGLIQFFLGFFTFLHGLFTWNTGEMQQGFATMGNGIKNIVLGMWNAVSAVFIGAFNVIKAFVSGFISGIVGFFTMLANTLVHHSIIPDMLNSIRNVFVTILTFLIGFVVGFVTGLVGHFVSFGTRVVGAVTNAFNMFRFIVTVVISFVIAVVTNGAASMLSHIILFGSQMISTGTNAFNNFRNAVSNGINTAITTVQGLPGKAVAALSNLGSMLFNSGATAMQQFASGLTSAIGNVTNAVSNAAGQVANFLQHKSPAKYGPLADDDKWMPNMMSMFAQGIDHNIPLLQNASVRAAGGIGGIASAPSTSRLGSTSAGGSGGMSTVNLVLDGNVLGQVVVNHITGQMQLNGLGRAFR